MGQESDFDQSDWDAVDDIIIKHHGLDNKENILGTSSITNEGPINDKKGERDKAKSFTLRSSSDNNSPISTKNLLVQYPYKGRKQRSKSSVGLGRKFKFTLGKSTKDKKPEVEEDIGNQTPERARSVSFSEDINMDKIVSNEFLQYQIEKLKERNKKLTTYCEKLQNENQRYKRLFKIKNLRIKNLEERQTKQHHLIRKMYHDKKTLLENSGSINDSQQSVHSDVQLRNDHDHGPEDETHSFEDDNADNPVLSRIERSFYKSLKNENKRDLTVKEFYYSEKRYVANLTILKEEYINQIKKKNLISKQNMIIIFGEFDLIYNINKIFLSKLEEMLFSRSKDEVLVEMCLTFSKSFKLYSKYIEKFSKSNQLLNEEIKKKKKLQNFLNKKSMDLKSIVKKGVETTIFGLMITPVQRIPRYLLLLKDLLKNTKETSSQYQKLEQAVKIIKNILVFCNEQSKIQNQKSMVVN